MAMDVTSYVLSKGFTSDTADSLGAVKGAPCTIKSQTETDGSYIITFEWTGTSGATETSQLIIKKPKDGIDGLPGLNGKDGSDGIGISKIEKIGTVDLVDTYRITFTDNSTFDYELKNGKNGADGQPGQDGFSPTITENANNTDKIYKLNITTADSAFTTPNLKGADGTGGEGASTWSEISDKPFESLSTDFSVENGELKVVGGTGSGEENKFDSISVNGVNVSPDENKNVDITVPSIEGLTKDADLATVAKSGSYEDLSNKPEIPSVEGLAKTTDIPTKVSQLENDSNYLSSIPEEYVTDTELEAKGYLTEHQDISGKVDKVEGKSLIADTEIERLASVDNYDDTAIKAEIAKKADATSIPSKVSELTNDSNYQTAEQVNSIVTTEIAKVVADAPESLNTLKEMSDWITGHEDDASAMNSAISDNKTAITALQTGKADKSEIPTTVAELTDSADYAKKTDLHSHTNKTVLDGITEEKVTAWDKAEENVQSDWNETDDTANGFIKNKPTIPDAYDDTALYGRVKSVEEQIANILDSKDNVNSGSKWKGKTLNFMGDSITEGYASTVKYTDIIASTLSATCNNYGIGGSTVANGQNPMYSRVLQMEEDADLCVVFGGTNDFANYDRILGEQFIVSNGKRTLNLDTNTFYGGLNQLCTNLYSRFPYSSLVLCTPINRKSFAGQETDMQANGNGLYLDEYVEAIKKVAAYFSIPCLDLYSTVNLHPYDAANIEKYYSASDQLHPNAEGHKHIANVMLSFFDTLADKRGRTVHTHSYTSEVTIAATCTRTGVRTFTCECGASYTESIPATGHRYADGFCSVCGEVEVLEVKAGFYDLGGRWYPSPYSGEEYQSWKIPCNAGDKFTQYSTSKYGMYKTYWDADGNFISSNAPANGSPTTFTVPNNAAIVYMWAAIRGADIKDGSYRLVRETVE